MPVLIAPSILSADLSRLGEEVASIEPYADWLQIDVMDGHFVPNLSFGAPVARCLKTRLPLDIHLMVANPADRLKEFLEIPVANVTFHAEAVTDAEARRAIIRAVHAAGATAGIALNPATPVSAIDDVIGEVDLVLAMTVQPGFGGQPFRPEVLEKVRSLRAAHPRLMIQVDGGVNAETAALCREAGADNLVAGSYLFSAKDRARAIASLRSSS